MISVERTTRNRHFLRGSNGAIGSTTTRTRTRTYPHYFIKYFGSKKHNSSYELYRRKNNSTNSLKVLSSKMDPAEIRLIP
jgi:hypothetical protein